MFHFHINLTENFWLCIVEQFWANFFFELATLILAFDIFRLNRSCLSIPMLFIFLMTFLLSDLAIVLYLCELALTTHGKLFSVKFEEDPNAKPFFVPVLIEETE